MYANSLLVVALTVHKQRRKPFTGHQAARDDVIVCDADHATLRVRLACRSGSGVVEIVKRSRPAARHHADRTSGPAAALSTPLH